MSADNLMSLVSSALVSGFALDDFGLAAGNGTLDEVRVIQNSSGGLPGDNQSDGSLVADTDSEEFRTKVQAGNWHAMGSAKLFPTNATGNHIRQGSIVVFTEDTSGNIPAVAPNNVSNGAEIIGVANVTLADGVQGGPVVTSGFVEMRVDGPITAGDLLVGSSQTGVAVSHTANGLDPDGNFTGGIAFAQALTSVPSGPVTTVTVWLFGG